MSVLGAIMVLATPLGVTHHEVPQQDRVDASYETVATGQDARAIRAFDMEDAIAQGDPALLINLGIAHAPQGRTADARTLFEAAEGSEMRYRLETAQGERVDSRWLARRALAMLDRGEFRAGRMAQR